MNFKSKEFLIGALAATLLTSPVTALADSLLKTIEISTPGVKVIVDDNELSLKDQNGNKIEPMISEGTTYLPVRAFLEAIGADVDWDQQSKTITVNTKFTSETLMINSRDTKIPVTIVIPKSESNEKFPLAVIAHGHGGNKDENGGFNRIAEGLAKKGIASIRMDFPGCGDSTESFQKNVLSIMLQDIDSSVDYAIENMPIDKDNIGIIGYSMGGRLALTEAVKSDTFKWVATLAPSADPGEEFLESFVPNYQELYDTAKENGYVDYTTVWGQVQELSKEWFDELIESNPTKLIEGYKGPLLVVYGDKDVTVPNSVQEKLIETAEKSAEVEKVLVPGADHGYGFYGGDNAEEISNTVVNSIVDFAVKCSK